MNSRFVCYRYFSNGLQRYAKNFILQIFLQYFCKNFENIFHSVGNSTDTQSFTYFVEHISLIINNLENKPAWKGRQAYKLFC